MQSDEEEICKKVKLEDPSYSEEEEEVVDVEELEESEEEEKGKKNKKQETIEVIFRNIINRMKIIYMQTNCLILKLC